MIDQAASSEGLATGTTQQQVQLPLAHVPPTITVPSKEADMSDRQGITRHYGTRLSGTLERGVSYLACPVNSTGISGHAQGEVGGSGGGHTAKIIWGAFDPRSNPLPFTFY